MVAPIVELGLNFDALQRAVFERIKAMKMQVTIHISNEIIEDILITANQHCGIWAQVTKESDHPRGEDEDEGYYDKLLCEEIGGWTEYGIVDCYDGTLTDERKRLTYFTIQSGLKIMSEKYPRHFGDFMNHNHDAITADVFLQCCLFGEIVYG